MICHEAAERISQRHATLFVTMSSRWRKTKNPGRWLHRGWARACQHGQQDKKKHRDQEQPEVFLWQHEVILDADIVRQEAETLHVARAVETAHGASSAIRTKVANLLSASLFAKYRCWISIRGSKRRKIARNCAHHDKNKNHRDQSGGIKRVDFEQQTTQEARCTHNPGQA
jgi:hypothetical protein